MCESIPLIKVLPLVQHVIGVLLGDAVDVHSIQVHWREEKDGQPCTSVDVSAYVLVVESYVHPSTGPCKVRAHY